MSPINNIEEVRGRIAKLEIQGVAACDIMEIFSISQEQLHEFTAAEEYRSCKAGLLADSIEEANARVEGWDMVESLAIGHLVDTLEFAPEPELALKMAAVANKAQRRTRHHSPIAGNESGRAVLHLTLSFAEKLQSTFKVQLREDDGGKEISQNVDIMSVKDVQSAFSKSAEPFNNLGLQAGV